MHLTQVACLRLWFSQIFDINCGNLDDYIYMLIIYMYIYTYPLANMPTLLETAYRGNTDQDLPECKFWVSTKKSRENCVSGLQEEIISV